MTKKLLDYFAGDELAASTWENKYALRDDMGELLEQSPEEMHHRLAREFWRVEKDFIDKAIIDRNKLSEYGQKRKDLSEETIFKLFDKFKYIVPAGSVMAGAGGGRPVSLSNCFVLPTMPKDSYTSIMMSRLEMVQLEKRRGGGGTDISNLRPRGAFVNNAAKTSTGAASFMEGFSAINNEVAQCIEENQEILTERGLVKIKDINIGDKVLTRKGFVKVIGKFDKGIKDTIILKTKQGTELKATSDHVIMSADNTIGPINKKISELKVGDPVGILLGENIITEYQTLTHSYQKPLSRTLKSGEKIPHNRYEDITIPTILNEKLAYLVGYAHGDGYTEKRKTGRSLSLSVTSCSNDIETINKIISYRKDVFGKDVHERKGDGNCVKIHICATEGCEFLKENGLDKPKTEFLRVPEKIWNSPSSVQMAYLSGLFDADGYASGSKKGYTYCTVNEKFSKDIRKLLNLNGIFSKCHVEIPKNKKWSTKYNTCIVGKYNQNLFVQKALESVKVQSKKFISKRDGIISPFIIGIEGIKKQPHIQYKTLISCASLNKAGYRDKMIALDYITEIFSEGKNHVYDIELESENMFWCEGVYVHNCGRRGALMITLSIAHPDSPEFITVKQDLTKVTGANISVKIPDDFMKAVEKNEDYLLHWPVQGDHVPIKEVEMEYNILYPSQYTTPDGKTERGYIKKVRAKELWDTLIHCAWNTAEPGILFESTLHGYAPDGVYPKFKMVSTNPCITGDTKVLIKISGKEEMVEVESLPGRMINDHIEILSFNLSTNTVEWKDLQRAHLTKRNADIITLIVSNGTNNLELKLTPDHKVYSIVKSGYIEAKDLSIGESVWIYIDGNLSRAEIISKESCLEKEDVFDLTVKDNHNFFANGILIKNCGEIPMGSGDSCRLIHVNLSSFVKNSYLPGAEVDWDKLYSVFYEATRLGDDLVTLEEEAVDRILNIVKTDDPEYAVWDKIKKTAREGRRSGVGFFGLSDMIAMLGIKFCSPESIEIVDKVCHKMMEAELDAEVDLAIERGMFPAWNKTYETADANKWYKFISTEYPEQWERMQKHGRRNISFSTVAPTGCLVGSTELLVDGSNMSIQEFFEKNNINIEELEDKKSIWFDPIDKFHVYDIYGNKHLITKLYWNGISKTKKIKFQNNEVIECTNSHRFLVKVDEEHATWKTAEDIKPGDKLIQSVRNNNPVEFNDVKEDIELFDLKDLQYNELDVISVEDSVNLTMDIEVEDTHYYTLSNGLISHNTVAMVSRASSGIEPVFMPFYMRRRKCNSDSERVDFVDKMGVKFQEFIVVHPGLEEWAKITYPGENIKDWKLDKWQEVFEKSPWYGSTSPEIDWEKRVELQGVVQKYITHAISSTVNLPNNVTEDEVSKIYMTAWKTGNKGQTIYRDGSRDGILVKAEEKRRDDKFRSYVEAPKRPKVLPADFYTTKVKGELFYVMVGLYLDKPYEIFVFKPDLGENEKSPKQHRGEITKIKRGVYTFKSDLITIENISKDLSPLEGTVSRFSSMLLRSCVNPKYIIDVAQKSKDGINGFVTALIRILSRYLNEEVVTGETCPDCGHELTREGGCIICKDCGYSKCL